MKPSTERKTNGPIYKGAGPPPTIK